jgi:hypothetical protein
MEPDRERNESGVDVLRNHNSACLPLLGCMIVAEAGEQRKSIRFRAGAGGWANGCLSEGDR